jgi:plastocyanin
LVVAGLAIAGCGDDDDEGSTEDVGATTTAAPDAGGDAAGDDAADGGVVMAGFAFEPTELTVAAGATIPVTNEDSAAHTFTSDDGGFDVEVDGGASGEATAPDEPGTYDFVCRFHPDMTGTLTVE